MATDFGHPFTTEPGVDDENYRGSYINNSGETLRIYRDRIAIIKGGDVDNIPFTAIKRIAFDPEMKSSEHPHLKIVTDLSEIIFVVDTTQGPYLDVIEVGRLLQRRVVSSR